MKKSNDTSMMPYSDFSEALNLYFHNALKEETGDKYQEAKNDITSKIKKFVTRSDGHQMIDFDIAAELLIESHYLYSQDPFRIFFGHIDVFMRGFI